MRRNPSLLILSIALGSLVVATGTAVAGSGVYYRAVTEVDKGPGSSTVDAWVEGEKARIEFVQSSVPMIDKGSYLVTRDAGKTLFLVNPKDETFSKWDLQAMLQAAGQVIEGMGGMVQMEFSDPQVENLGEQDGGTLVGLATRQHSFRTAYTIKVKVLGMKRRSTIESEQQIWASSDLDMPAMAVWLRTDQPTGNEDLDKIIAAEYKQVTGFPVKTVTVTTTRDKKGREQTSRSVMEVTELRQGEELATTSFEVPAGYDEVPMPVFGAANDNGEGEANPLGGLFGRGGGR